VCVQEENLGKVAKSCTAQIKGRIFFFLNKSKLFANICPEYGFRVKCGPTNSLHYSLKEIMLS